MPRFVFNPFTGSLDAVEEGHHSFEATCTGAEELYDMVYVISSDYNVRTVDIDDINKMPPVGMIVRIDGTSCTVQTGGEVPLVGLSSGWTYFIGTDGKMSPVRPSRPSSGKRFIQVCGVALDTALLLIRLDGSPTRILPA